MGVNLCQYAKTCGILLFLSFLDTGDLFSLGTNKSGVCGLGHDEFQFFPVQVSFNVGILSVRYTQVKLSKSVFHIADL